MRKTAAALVLALFLITGAASAVELTAEPIRAFNENILTVSSEDGGRLTIEAFNGTVPMENPVTDMKVGPGEVRISWNALSYGGEPAGQGRITLRATLRGPDRTVEQTEITVRAEAPRSAAVYCLPAAQEFYADGKTNLKIETAMASPGTCEVSIAAKENPGEEIWHDRVTARSREPVVVRWNGRNRKGKVCPPGEYVISAWGRYCTEYVCTSTVTLTEAPLPEPELAVTGGLMPADPEDDAAVWAALMAPVAVGDGPEGMALRIMNGKGARTGYAGTVICRTVGVDVLEICGDGWVRIGAWTSAEGRWAEGYVKAEKLRMIRPNTRYGAVVDKQAQTMTIYEYGKKLGTVAVSTGLTTEENREADTHSGVYLMGTRMEDFSQDGHIYCYPVRIDGRNLIHQVGFAREDGTRNFEEELALLGTKASHGCIRVDARSTEENSGLNAWWIWTHMGHDTKIIVLPGE